VRRKTIYEYHRVNMKNKHIANLTAIYLKALPRCNQKLSCGECLGLTVQEDDHDVEVILIMFSLAECYATLRVFTKKKSKKNPKKNFKKKNFKKKIDFFFKKTKQFMPKLLRM
jgi:hypothetical protein